MTALEILNNNLEGNFIRRFSIGDTFDLYFGDCWLITHDLISEDEVQLNRWLEENYLSYNNTVDKENISKSAILAAHLQKEVIGVQLDNLCNLSIEFENDSKLILTTNVGIVDWQWCLNETGNNPYSDYLVACFWKGEIQINNDKF